MREIRPWFASRLRVSSLRLSLKLTLNFNMQARRSYGGGHFGHRSLTGSFKDHFHDSDINHSKDGGVSSKGGDAKVGPGSENTRQRTGGAK